MGRFDVSQGGRMEVWILLEQEPRNRDFQVLELRAGEAERGGGG
jgi:hypothetical protein